MDQGSDLRVQLRLYGDKPREKEVSDVLQALAQDNGESINETAKRILMVFAKAASQNPAINLTLAQKMAAVSIEQMPAVMPQQNSTSEPLEPTSPPQKTDPVQPKVSSSGVPEVHMDEL